jgi:FPC/CPF motif-containing protein YcgG
VQTRYALAAICGASFSAAGAKGFPTLPGATSREIIAGPSRLNQLSPSTPGPDYGRSASQHTMMRSHNDVECLTSANFFSQATLRSFIDKGDDTHNGPWMEQVSAQLDRKLGDRAFPCPFSRLTHRRDIQKMIFVNQDAPGSLTQLRDQMTEYTDYVKQDDSMFRPLVVFFKPATGKAVADYHAQGWSVLQFLHNNDAAEWPNDTPRDTEHYLWSFCFNGVQLSVNMSNPAQKEHKARDLGDAMVLVFNPRKDFDAVAGNTKPGREVRETIRAALSEYEGLPPSDNLGTYGDPENLEWRQYASEETGEPLPKKCPLNTLQNLFRK